MVIGISNILMHLYWKVQDYNSTNTSSMLLLDPTLHLITCSVHGHLAQIILIIHIIFK